ncbi:fucolectin-1-like [Haliotis rubra]|uniref:fucolectin-1-like n=1 Tax=Haliotis rubra TaxID=36100 RepID=UPI001EE5B241|nr:fucolectin-1-like [Haliotis rubra]
MLLLKAVLLLTLGTVVTCIVNNLALNKPTSSSTSAHLKGRAIDGNRDSTFLNHSCFQSQDGDMQPYWMVDLQSDFVLEYLTITNRGDCCGGRMHNLKIEVFTDDPVQNPLTPSHLCAMYDGPMAGGATENISCSCAAQGRYVRVRGLDRKSEKDLLTLCEVEVYERTQTWCFNTKLQRLVGTRYVGNVVPVDVTSAVECSTHCSYNRSCIGFNYNYNTHDCELRVGSANASSANDWFYFFQLLCR